MLLKSIVISDWVCRNIKPTAGELLLGVIDNVVLDL